MSAPPTRGRERAWGWVAHVRDGGTVPWESWTGEAAPGGRSLPGAQQLELLRRLNEVHHPPATLAQRVLAASAPGRGRPDLELVGVEEEQRFGPSPADPSALAAPELVRVAAGLIAEDLVAGAPAPVAPRRPRRRRRRYRLAGDPWLAGPLRAALTADGRPPGGIGAAVHVLGSDLATMLGHSWTTGTFAEGGPSWPDFLNGLRGRDRVAKRVDLVAIADRWCRGAGVAGVNVVLDLATLPRLLGVRGPLPEPPTMAAHAAELSRQVAGALGLLVVPPRRAELLGGVLLPRLAEVPGPPVAVPAEHRDWVEERATWMRRRLLAGGYPVVGEPDVLLPRWAGSPVDRGFQTLSGVANPDNVAKSPTGTPEDPVLTLALDLLLRPVTESRSSTSAERS